MIDHPIGFVGIVFGLLIGVPQLVKIIKTRRVKDVALWTYIFLVLAMTCYLYNAVYIGSAVFVITNSVGLIINGTILCLLLKWRVYPHP